MNGWQVFTKTGIYGTEYLDRALVTAIGLGANRPQDAIYPTSEKDAAGKEYDGASNKYVMHIDKGQIPPVNGFWSLTMYEPSISLCQMRSIGTRSAPAIDSSPMLTGRLTFICRRSLPARTRKPTGCLLRRRSSFR